MFNSRYKAGLLAALLIIAMFVSGCVHTSKETPSPSVIPPMPDAGRTEAPTQTPASKPSPSQDIPAPTKDLSAMPEQAEFIEVLNLKIGSGENELGYFEKPFPMYVTGPASFHVDGEGWIAVLDTYNLRVTIYEDSRQVYEIDLKDELVFPYFMCYSGEGFYILDITMEYVLFVDFTHDYIGKDIKHKPVVYELPEGCQASLVSGLDYTENGVTIYGNPHIYNLKDGSFIVGEETVFTQADDDRIIYKKGDMNWAIKQMENCRIEELYGTDKDGFAYVKHYEDFPEAPWAVFEKTIRCYNPLGEMYGCARIDDDKYFTFPTRDVIVMPDGRVYHMACLEDRVVIYEIILGRTYESRGEELVEDAIREYEQSIEEGIPSGYDGP